MDNLGILISSEMYWQNLSLRKLARLVELDAARLSNAINYRLRVRLHPRMFPSLAKVLGIPEHILVRAYNNEDMFEKIGEDTDEICNHIEKFILARGPKPNTTLISFRGPANTPPASMFMQEKDPTTAKSVALAVYLSRLVGTRLNPTMFWLTEERSLALVVPRAPSEVTEELRRRRPQVLLPFIERVCWSDSSISFTFAEEIMLPDSPRVLEVERC